MERLQINELTERYTAAMVDAVLGQRLWQGPTSLFNPDELSEYLMLDTQDSAQLEATWVSSTVRCLQQHIQSVYSGMEPGYESSYFESQDVDYWYQILSHYSTWSANVMLKDQAENYIVPSLRLKKTALFRSLESSLNQMRLSTDSVQRALMEYVQAFQRICDLDVISGYIDGADKQNARYCLIGQERTPPFAYHWRDVKVAVDNKSERINPTAWSEWQKIDIGTADKVVDIRPVYWGGRLMLIWCEWRERQVDSNGVVQMAWSLEIKASTSSLNQQWSPPVSLHQRYCDYDVSNGRLTAVSLGGGDPRDDLLAVCYTNRQSLDAQPAIQEIEILETRDALFRKVPDPAATVLEMAFARFRNASSLQQKVGPEDYSPVTMTSAPVVIGSINAHLLFDAIYIYEIVNGNTFEVLRVRGRCTAVRETGRSIRRVSIGWRTVSPANTFDIKIVDAGEKRLRFSMTTQKKPTQNHVVQLREKLGGGDKDQKIDLYTFKPDDFEQEILADGVWVAEAVATLSDTSSGWLLGRTLDEVRAGAGFTMTGDVGDAALNEENQVVPFIQYASVPFQLKLGGRTDLDPLDWLSTGPLDGQYATPWLVYRREAPSVGVTAFPINEEIKFEFGSQGADGRNLFAVTLTRRPRQYTTPSIDKTSTQGAQFLSFNNPAQALKHVRVNSTFGPVLISRAAVSVDALLAWETQHIDEPQRPDGTIEKNGPFDGCNGLYFWEMFFHTPDLVGSRLTSEGRYREAQSWYGYVFDPLARVTPKPGPEVAADPELIPAPAYWRCRPLGNELDPAYEIEAPTDPDAIGYSAPVHLKIALFLRYVDNLVAWGDSQYRRLDYDSMVAARLNYSRALTLMGREFTARTATTWQPQNLKDLLTGIRGRDELKAFENRFELRLADIPAGMVAKPRFDLLGSGVFLPGINERPEALRALLKSRLENLRQNRSIDGQPLSIPIFSQPLDPLNLLRAQGNANPGEARNPGGQVQVVPYKWQTVNSLAFQGVEFLIQQEDQLRSWLEQRDRGALEELQQGHMIELVDYARSVHAAEIAQLEATATSLRHSESMLRARVEHYQGLIDEGVSQVEYDVLEKSKLARQISLIVGPSRLVGAALDATLLNIAGVAAGGYHWGALAYAVADNVQMLSDYLMREADEASINEQYRRREQEWAFVLDQSKAESRVLSAQILAQQHAISSAQASLLQVEAANTQALAVYAFYKNRTTGQDLSNWVIGQVKTLIYQAYDLVAGLCLCAETCWQYEMGDFQSRFVRPDVWMDTYHGLTTGYSLKLDLMKMAAARLKRDERRLELVKTISLRALCGDKWQASIEKGQLDFSLNERLFNEDYPGHYCRQVKRVALSFPGLLGPYENVRAVLVQTSSATTLQPNIAAVKYLHADSTGTVPDSGVLVQNLRPYQQVALSLGLDDSGTTGPLEDDRYQSFEGTGAHAKYVLTFPRPGQAAQRRLLDSLTDIILTLTYKARDAGPEFAADIEALLTGGREMATTPDITNHATR